MKTIRNFEGIYTISSKGDVYSLVSNRFLTLSEHNQGYLRVSLTKDGKTKQYLVHRLVAETYLPNPDNKPTVNHINGNKLNNNISNLEWSTYSENNQHAVDSGLRGDTRKYANEIGDRICGLTMDGFRPKDIANMLGIPDGGVKTVLWDKRYLDYQLQYNLKDKPAKNKLLSDEKIIDICKRLEEGQSYQQISKEVGVARHNISVIKQRKVHRLISNSFNF